MATSSFSFPLMDYFVVAPYSNTRGLAKKLATRQCVTNPLNTNRQEHQITMTNSYRLLFLLMITVIFAACQSGTDADSGPADGSQSMTGSLWDSIATYSGTLPCASCPGIETTIQFKPDRTAFILDNYLEAEDGKGGVKQSVGRWVQSADGKLVVVRDGSEDGRRFGIVSADTLRLLDGAGDPIESDLPYVITRVDGAEPIVAEMELAGMYQYYADAAIIELCGSRTRYPVAMEEEHVKLEEAYMAADKETAQPLYATFVGRVEMRPKMEGDGEREFVIVSKFEELSPEQSCYGDKFSIEGTVWSLDELNGRIVHPKQETSVPNLVLIPEDHRAAGSGGCNRFTGSYELVRDTLTFGQMATTQMACPEGMDTESVFMQSLSVATSFDHYGDKLELLMGNRVLARFTGTRLEE